MTAIEPSSGMRDAFNKNEGLIPFLSGDASKTNIVVKDGSFGEIPVPDASIDLIVGEYLSIPLSDLQCHLSSVEARELEDVTHLAAFSDTYLSDFRFRTSLFLQAHNVSTGHTQPTTPRSPNSLEY